MRGESLHPQWVSHPDQTSPLHTVTHFLSSPHPRLGTGGGRGEMDGRGNHHLSCCLSSESHTVIWRRSVRLVSGELPGALYMLEALNVN